MIGYIILSIIAVLIIIILVRTFNFKSKRIETHPVKNVNVDVKKAAKNLSGAVQIKTVSTSDYVSTDWDEFKKFIKYLENTYPLIHQNLEREIVNGYSLLYRWRSGKNDKKPILIMAHIDVVPVEKENEKNWIHKPFSGEIADGYVWGRGTLDIKIHLISALEAIESLLEEGYKPDRDIYLAFGHDEEVGGKQGALQIVKLLEEREINFEYIIDEGGCINVGAIKSIDSPIAFVGICEKGYANIKLTVQSTGGHASMPPKNTSVGIISKAIASLEKHQLKLKISKPVREFLNYIGPEMNFPNKMILANMWLFKGLFKKIFSSFPAGNALLRTTTAATMAQGSIAANVLPQKSTAVFNFRIAPHDTTNGLISHIKEVTKGLDIQIESLRLEEPSKISSITSKAFKTLEKTIYEIYPDVLVSPYVVLAGTDSKKYESICNDIYRFTPYKIDKEDLTKIHGTNERISLENIKKCVLFFKQLIINS